MHAGIHKIVKSCTGNHRLDVRNVFQKIVLPVAVKLREHVVQKQDGLVAGNLLDQPDL